ncbi:hypothetical protein CfE428DRAFT_1415 [Chthoniobacter flavus Ellin428]|uniref:Uncharacterized protein n=1 Tax=Chthoniobacter flavus Ellin428 TaxID=497964 RepID=B4CXX4_9BACT|nr:hypothetical protein CfE428DRAFT_1415 [Chthoniobacter flavus Ellin428]
MGILLAGPQSCLITGTTFNHTQWTLAANSKVDSLNKILNPAVDMVFS